jgi:ATP-dependent helicase HrpB
LRDEVGDVLVFLPGIGEIRRVESMLRDRVPGHVDVRPLAGALALADQDLALAPSPAGRRRVVLSTDIAESSLTVAGIRVVVDAGLARVPRFDPRTGMSRLTTVSTSRASADQRAGRAGRTEPGVCYRLWSKLEQGTRLAHLPAEITQVDLAGLALELAAWGSKPESLAFLDPPPAKALQTAQQLLVELDALDERDELDEGDNAAEGDGVSVLLADAEGASETEAADVGDSNVACALIRAGADVNARSVSVRTPCRSL